MACAQSSCDCDVGSSEMERLRAESRKYTFSPDFTWDGVRVERYKSENGGWSGISRMILAGYSEKVAFHLRYFEVAPGGYSSLEKHVHSHVVVGVRGKGRVIVGEECWDVGFMDVIYISPGTPHQLVNAGPEPFGFLCLVDAERDRPSPLTSEEIERLRRNPAICRIIQSGLGEPAG
ncbi:MAG: cupin domain-containing protein [Firmicutes bacterium]|nr:cupin domain-containing protein [Bacillota bacterium]